MSDGPDLEYALGDGTVVQVHQKAAAQRGTRAQALGRSRGGLTTKIVALVDALAYLVRVMLMTGQAHDLKRIAFLIQGVSLEALLADKTFDAN